MYRKMTGMVLFVTVIFIVAIVINEKYFLDQQGPVIQYQGDTIVYYEGEDLNELLLDVSARDDKDGDVTDSLLIESTTVLKSNDKMIVRYAARDSKNNVTVKERLVTYIPLSSQMTNNGSVMETSEEWTISPEEETQQNTKGVANKQTSR